VIAPGPGDAVWFTEFRGDRIGRIAGEGDAAWFPARSPYGITAGSDGAVWFTELQTGTIGWLTVDGEPTRLAGWGMPR
jgi:virginiamycin B lyase